MKQCPRCSFIYADNTLEFCLEDGSRLVSETNPQIANHTAFASNKSTAATEQTVSLPFSGLPETIELQGAKNITKVDETPLVKKEIFERNFKIVEISSITIALIHNWWQWVYLNNQYYSTFSAYVLSANFLMWLLLLVAGIGIGAYAIKRAPNKIVPIIGLIILAVNLILFAVPKR